MEVNRLAQEVTSATTLVARLALGRAHAVPRVFQVPGPLHL